MPFDSLVTAVRDVGFPVVVALLLLRDMPRIRREMATQTVVLQELHAYMIYGRKPTVIPGPSAQTQVGGDD